MPRHRAPGHRCTAVLLAAALAGVGPSAVVPTAAAAAPKAAPTTAPAATSTSEPDPLADAQRLYDRGKAKFETADYADAIELWTEAYAIVPETSEGAQIKGLLLYNIATAREKQFDVSRDPAELRQATILLESFERSIPTLYGEGPEAEAERTKVQSKIAELEARLREHEAQLAAAEGDDDADEDTTPPPPEPTPPPDDGQQRRGARGLVIGGAVAAGLGVGGLGLMAAGLGMGARANDISDLAPDDVDGRRARFDRGRTGNALAIAGGVAGGVLLLTGAVLLGLGLKRARAGRASDVALVPAPSRDGAALVLQGRF
jgi:tetratricopeptide (TPR) repeat protein